jgi:hypothetical protein
VLKMLVGDNITEKDLNSIADQTIREADADKDGKISFKEFSVVRCCAYPLGLWSQPAGPGAHRPRLQVLAEV